MLTNIFPLTAVAGEQIIPAHGDPTSCTVVSPSPTVHNEPDHEQEHEPIEVEKLDSKHYTSRGISLAQLTHRSSEADEDEPIDKMLLTKKAHKPETALDSSEQLSHNEDLKAENAELLATVANLMEKLRRADARRKDAANELAYRRASFSTSEADLKGRLLGQEEQNTHVSYPLLALNPFCR